MGRMTLFLHIHGTTDGRDVEEILGIMAIAATYFDADSVDLAITAIGPDEQKVGDAGMLVPTVVRSGRLVRDLSWLRRN